MTKGAKISLVFLIILILGIAAYFLYFKWHKPKADKAAEEKRLAEAALLEKANEPQEVEPQTGKVVTETPGSTKPNLMFEPTATKAEALEKVDAQLQSSVVKQSWALS